MSDPRHYDFDTPNPLYLNINPWSVCNNGMYNTMSFGDAADRLNVWLSSEQYEKGKGDPGREEVKPYSDQNEIVISRSALPHEMQILINDYGNENNRKLWSGESSEYVSDSFVVEFLGPVLTPYRSVLRMQKVCRDELSVTFDMQNGKNLAFREPHLKDCIRYGTQNSRNIPTYPHDRLNITFSKLVPDYTNTVVEEYMQFSIVCRITCMPHNKRDDPANFSILTVTDPIIKVGTPD